MIKHGTATVRQARPADLVLIAALIRGLAEYENHTQDFSLDVDELNRHLFGPKPFAEVLIAELGEEPIGFALFFHNYSTFLGKPGIYMEDLFVLPSHRGCGAGRALLTRLAEIAIERDCARLEWSVLKWNKEAVGFYHHLGAAADDDRNTYRIAGKPLFELASASKQSKGRNPDVS
ncbi:MAG TPA: GNAT family N-acetyltransferase [Candidatus Dormibacteraeota bacterium]|jgi:GNAT superfamily N-acetyltransferase|nr:GNAT family N-acetyltransferase [Candidatus Dormibacteraeota bacterium]